MGIARAHQSKHHSRYRFAHTTPRTPDGPKRTPQGPQRDPPGHNTDPLRTQKDTFGTPKGHLFSPARGTRQCTTSATERTYARDPTKQPPRKPFPRPRLP